MQSVFLKFHPQNDYVKCMQNFMVGVAPPIIFLDPESIQSPNSELRRCNVIILSMPMTLDKVIEGGEYTWSTVVYLRTARGVIVIHSNSSRHQFQNLDFVSSWKAQNLYFLLYGEQYNKNIEFQHYDIHVPPFAQSMFLCEPFAESNELSEYFNVKNWTKDSLWKSNGFNEICRCEAYYMVILKLLKDTQFCLSGEHSFLSQDLVQTIALSLKGVANINPVVENVQIAIQQRCQTTLSDVLRNFLFPFENIDQPVDESEFH